jgi:hypothetical protein
MSHDEHEITPVAIDEVDAARKIEALARRRMRDGHERIGQATFNAAWHLWPDAVRDLVGGRLDPFTAMDGAPVIAKFVEEVAKRATGGGS